MHADGGPGLVRAQLHQVTDLTDEPEAVPAGGVDRGPRCPASGSSIVPSS